jgi:tetratricopeptide (TPR) repeat protein/transcriptional regulator with XRE-family HTH domain
MTIQRPTEATPLQRERRRRGWTQAEVVDRLNTLAHKLGLGELGIDANAVSRHERGVIGRPRPPLPELYARLYGRPVQALWPDTGSAIWEHIGIEGPGEDIETPGLDLPALGRHVGDADVARIRADAELFGVMNHRHGGGHVRWLVVEYLRREVTPLVHGVYSDRIGRELLAAAAVLTRRAGMMAYDSGRHGPARSYLGQALRLARAAGHRALAGHVLTSMSHQAIDLGREAEALAMLGAAHADATSTGAHTLVAKVAVMQARLHARLHHAHDCEAALALASGASERADPARDPDWIASADEAYLLGQFGLCYLDLGRPARAERYLRLSLNSYRSTYVRRRAMGAALLARSLADQGELDQASAIGVEAVTLATPLMSHRTMAAVGDLQSRLGPHAAVGAVAEFCDRAGALLNASLFEDATLGHADLGGVHGGTAGPVGHRPHPGVRGRGR